MNDNHDRTIRMLRDVEGYLRDFLATPPSDAKGYGRALERMHAARANAATWLAQIDEADRDGPKPWPFLGTCCEGTLRTGDLMESFRALLRDVALHNRLSRPIYGSLLDRAEAWLDACDGEDNGDEDTGPDIVADLIEALNIEAPCGLYFGAHPYDGAHFGYWMSEEMPEDVDTGDELPCAHCWEPGEYCDHFAVISDHGNVTMYVHRTDGPRGARWCELWAAV